MNEFENLNEEEKLKAENEFLKMKIMLEHGADFHKTGEDNMLPAGVENEFLNNIIEYEKQFQSRKRIKVFDKIGRPLQFRPVHEIPDAEIEQAWEGLSVYMQEHGIELSSCSPKVTARELYRFTTEELFEHETDDMHIPGMMSCFIYDEFYPDDEYDNTRYAVDDCMQVILSNRPMDWMPCFKNENIRLNNHYPLTNEAFKNIINNFKNLFDEIEITDITSSDYVSEKGTCFVKGNYAANGRSANETFKWNGSWSVKFEEDEKFGYWYITGVQIEGINL